MAGRFHPESHQPTAEALRAIIAKRDQFPPGFPHWPGVWAHEQQAQERASPPARERSGSQEAGLTVSNGSDPVPGEQSSRETRDDSDEALSRLSSAWKADWQNKPGAMPPPPPGPYRGRDEAIALTKKWATDHAYELVIAQSKRAADGDWRKVILVCSRSIQHKARRVSDKARKRQRTSRASDCEVKLHLLKRKGRNDWILRTMHGQHNHEPRKSHEPEHRPASDPDLQIAHAKLRKDQPEDVTFANLEMTTVSASSSTREAIVLDSIIESFGEDQGLICNVRDAVKQYMSRYDASHDWDHILRVTSLCKRLIREETRLVPGLEVDHKAAYLAALCHDLGDHKYAQPGENVENQISELLLAHGADSQLAARVQLIAKNVSFSNEVKNGATVAAVLQQHPELGFVQDADRLDAIGAVGIGRTFAFTAAKRPGVPMTETIEHFTDKLERLESMMKTKAAKLMARERTERLKTFRQWWADEYQVVE